MTLERSYERLGREKEKEKEACEDNTSRREEQKREEKNKKNRANRTVT